LAGGPGGYRGL